MLRVERAMQVFHGQSLRFADGWQERLAGIGLVAGGDWWNLSPGEAVTRAPITQCFRVALDAEVSIYFKRYVYPARSDRIYWMVPSKAAIEAWGLGYLGSLEIPTPQVLALGEQRRFGRVRAACIVTLGIPRAENLEQYVERHWPDWSTAQRSQRMNQIAVRLMAQLRRAHDAGFFHHDLKWRNILLSEVADGYQITWIDCPRARIRRLRRKRGRIVDLSSLARLSLKYFGLRRQVHFLRLYLGSEGDRDTLRHYLEEVSSHLSRRLPDYLKPRFHG